MTVTTDQVAAAERWLAPARLDDTQVLFIVGLADGYALDALDRKGWRGHVIALEPVGSAAPAWRDRTPVRAWQTAGRLTMLAGPDYSGLDKALAGVPLLTEKPVIAGNPAVTRAHREASAHAARAIARAWFGARANDEARQQNAGRYLLNTLRNRRAIATEGDAASLLGAFPGVPALVVAAGPSLDKNLSDIVSLRDRALVMAVDTALRPLLSAGVQPDLVVAVDPSEANALHLTDLPPCPETCFVAEGSIDPEALKRFAGRTFFFRVADHHPWPWLRTQGLDRQPLRAWGSVLTTAFDLALRMGCGPIVFAGADLSYTDDRPYARGTSYEEGWRREEAWGRSLEQTWAARIAEWPETYETGVAGVPVRTAPHLRSFRDWIVTEAGQGASTVINASGSGILVGESIQQATLVDSLTTRPPLPLAVRASIRGLRPARPAVARAMPAVPPEVQREWTTFAGVPAETIDEVFRPKVSAASVASAPAVADPSPPPRLHPGLSDADDAYLNDIAQRETVQLVVLANGEQDLMADIRRQAEGLAGNDALVIVDEAGIGAGAQVRRVVDAVLCERPDVWLEYRRFVEHSSRLTVLRGGAGLRTPPSADADRAKRRPEHQAVADSLVPLLVKQLAPASVVDVGCGAGFWAKALAAHGVSDVYGITPVDAFPDLRRRFDVCLCLEVAQQLPPDAQEALLDACTALSDVVVFSSTPPGVPGASPHDRPLPYWADKFWSRGYALDDRLRPLIQERWDSPRTVFDCLVIFRRSPSAQAVPRDWAIASATRIHELYMQGLWWSVLASDRQPASAPVAPQSQRQAWPIPSWRLLASDSPTRLFRFRTDEARWFLTHPEARLQVCEDGRPLAMVPTVAELSTAGAGGWTLWRDEITLRASDGSDPRNNGRDYTMTLPAHVARAESQPPHEIFNNNLQP